LVVEDGERLVPRFRCASCGGNLGFDEEPARYFAFVDGAPGATQR
jgi:hypothetical protein